MADISRHADRGYQTAGAPIVLTDPDNNTEKTAPQIKTYAQYDSRMWQRHMGLLNYEKIDEIRKDPTISFCRQVVAAPAIHTPWTIKASKKAPAKAKEFIEDVMMKHRLELLNSTFNGVMDYGWAPYETVYKVENGKIVVEEFKQLMQEFSVILIYVDTGGFAGYENWDLYGEYTTLLRKQCQHVCWEREGTYWYGRSTLDSVLVPYEAWNDTEETAGRYDRKISGGNWVVKYPVGQTPYKGAMTGNDEIANDLLSKLVGSGGLAIPDEVQEWLDDSVDKEYKGKWQIELVESRGVTAAAFIDRQKYLDNLKIRCFGLPERSVVEGKFGTKAEAEVHGDIALSTIDVKHRLSVGWYNKLTVNMLMALNYGPETVGSVWIEVAPLVDAQFQTLKEIYRLIIQSPQTIIKEANNVDTKALRDELGIPTDPNPDPIPDPQPNPFDKNSEDDTPPTEDEE